MVILRKKSICASSYGGIIRIRLRVEGHTFLSACLSKLPCVRKYNTTVDSCQFKEKHLIKNLIKTKSKKTNLRALRDFDIILSPNRGGINERFSLIFSNCESQNPF